MHENLGTRKIRRVPAGKRSFRTEVSLPQEALDAARVAAGDLVRVSVSRRGEIRLTPLRPDWPPQCSKTPGCLLRLNHAGDCILDAEVPF